MPDALNIPSTHIREIQSGYGTLLPELYPGMGCKNPERESFAYTGQIDILNKILQSLSID
jgi:hypothetical protein